VAQLPRDVPIVVSQWVPGEEVTANTNTWAQIDDGQYVYYTVFRPVALPGVPNPPAAGLDRSGKWIDLNTSLQVVVAYEGAKVIRAARTSTGEPGWETTSGVYSILRRVANETMDSHSLVGLDAQRASYRVENVLWTQYFSNDGKALHDNYWKARDEFGIPSSHGCAGLVEEDAKFFWDWADIGTPVYVHL
jgi:lipoprotein-anchoring transpeptidase ErfK/SrfK